MAGVMCIFTLTLVSVLYIFQGSSILARQKARDDLGSILAMVAKQRDQMTKDDPQALAHHLSLTMPAQVSSSDVTIRQEDDLTRFQIRIPGISSSYFLDYPMAGNCEGIRDMTYVASEDGGIIELSCDGVYVMSKTVKGDHLYLDLDRPSSVFDAMFNLCLCVQLLFSETAFTIPIVFNSISLICMYSFYRCHTFVLLVTELFSAWTGFCNIL